MTKAPVRLTIYWLVPVILIYLAFSNWLDIPLMYFISHDYQSSWFYTFSKILKIIFEPNLWFVIGVICAAYSYWAHKQKKYLVALPYTLPLGINLIFAFILTFILKVCFARYRPIDLLNSNLYGFHYFSLGGSQSTPSGHTVMTLTLFLTIAHFFKKNWITLLCFIPPILVALSRLVLAEHYVSDVILAAYVGTISVYWGEWILQRFYAAWIKPATHAQTN